MKIQSIISDACQPPPGCDDSQRVSKTAPRRVHSLQCPGHHPRQVSNEAALLPHGYAGSLVEQT